jgi:pilus assembly protein FimV
VLKPLINALGIITGLILSGVACAVGFGSANVSSALGEPLKAEIDLVEVTKAEKNSLFVRMAPPEAYKAAGVDYPYTLSKLKFEIETRQNGEPYVKVTSSGPVNDPFVTLLVELSWSSGKLMREYTFLLDPPTYKAEQPKAEEVTPIAPAVVAAPIPVAPEIAPAMEAASAPAAAAPEAAVVAPEVVSAPEVTTTALAPEAASAPQAAAPTEALTAAPEAVPAPQAPAAVPLAEAPTPIAAAEQPPVEAAPAKEPETITVRRGDTLTKIAAQLKEPDVTLEQMLVALYRANPREFDGRNMNRLRAGRILRMPDQAALERLSQTAAVKEIRIQTANWNAYRQKLAATAVPVPEEAPKQEAAGKVSTAVTDHAPPAKEAAKEVLKLSKGEAPGDHIAAAGAPGQKQAKEEEAIAKQKAAEEAGKRTAMLEKNVQEMQHLVELKGQSAVAPAASAVVAASAATGASAVQPAKPKPAPAKPKFVPAPAAQPSVLDEALGNPVYLGAGAAILLALGGLGFYKVRRRSTGGGKKKKSEPELLAEEVGVEEPARVAAAPAPAPAAELTRTVVGAGGKAAAKPAEPEEVDPVAEADLFLNFGRDAQAEEVLKDALSRDPSNRAVQLKLASIYANRKDANSLSTIARQLKDSGDAAAWEQIAALGRKIDPSNPMYGGTGGEAVETAAASGPSGVDIDLGTAVPMDFDVTGGGAKPEVAGAGGLPMDFDLTASPHAPAMDFDVTTRQPLSAIHTDFDVTGSQPNLAATQHMDFDVTGSQPNLAATQHMDFDVTGTHPGIVAEQHAEVAPVAPGLMMDFDISASPAPAVSAPAEQQPAAPALEFGDLVFDVTTPPAAEAPKAPATKDLDIGLGGISLDFEPAAPAGAEEATKDEQWHEVATKLDLAKAYHEMGDADGAREILGEVLRDGDEQQRAAAEALMSQL